MAEQMQQALAILRRKQVEARTGLRRSTIYAKIAAGEFPASIRLGARSVGWVESEISEWLKVPDRRKSRWPGGRHECDVQKRKGALCGRPPFHTSDKRPHGSPTRPRRNRGE